MANNPYVNKVVFGSATLVDLTGTTATADKIMQGYGAFGADGAWMDGTATGSGSGAVWQDAQGYVHLSEDGDIDLQTKSVTPTESAQTVVADAGYYALDKVNVGAVSSTYVGSGITRRSSSDLTASGATVTAPSGYYVSNGTKTIASGSATPASTISATGASITTGTNTLTLSKSVSNTPSVSAGYISSGTAGNSSVSLTATVNIRGSSDLTASGATVTAPAGYYASSASKSVATGTAGTPTATKGTVSNHAVTVTPSVTNTSGYITGSTKTGTAVSVSASELVSGTYSVTSSGTKDVTNYASVSVPSGTEGTPTATKGAVSNHSISVTPSVTNVAGYISGGTKTGTAVTVTASELASGNKAITQNGTGIDVVGYSTVSVDVSSGVDLTTFTSSDGTTFTCNKTWAECFDLVDAGDQSALFTDGYGFQTSLVASRYDSTSIYYTLYDPNDGKPYMDIVYHSNGTITTTTPSHAATVLTTKTITANGTYTASSDSADGYSSVTVNVCGFDIPAFEVTWTPYGTASGAITCNKTYSQCDNLLWDADNPVTVGALVSTYTYQPETRTSPLQVYDDYIGGQPVLIYLNCDGYESSIMYKSDGTISLYDAS